MKIKELILCISLALVVSSCQDSSNRVYTGFKDGDLIFQRSMTSQSRAISVATKSEFTHVGIIYETKDGYYVFEAGSTVSSRPLKEWIESGKDGKYAVKRLKNSFVLTGKSISRLKEVGNSFKGLEYDIYFDWSDDKLYCSELVYKIFNRGAGIKIGKLEKLKDFDLSSKVVKYLLKKRYGDSIPFDETVISPKSMYNSPDLVTIHSDFK